MKREKGNQFPTKKNVSRVFCLHVYKSRMQETPPAIVYSRPAIILEPAHRNIDHPLVKECTHNHGTILATLRNGLANALHKRNRGANDHTDMRGIRPHQGLMSTGRCLKTLCAG